MAQLTEAEEAANAIQPVFQSAFQLAQHMSLNGYTIKPDHLLETWEDDGPDKNEFYAVDTAGNQHRVVVVPS